MVIVEKKSDGSIAMVAQCPSGQFSPDDYIVHDVPGWDWSKANLEGVDRSKKDWLTKIKWDGTTIVPA